MIPTNCYAVSSPAILQTFVSCDIVQRVPFEKCQIYKMTKKLESGWTFSLRELSHQTQKDFDKCSMCLMISLSAMCICNIYFIRKRNRIVYIYTGALSELPPMFDGTQGHSPTTPQAYVFSDLLTLVSCDIVIVYQINKCLSKQMFQTTVRKKN